MYLVLVCTYTLAQRTQLSHGSYEKEGIQMKTILRSQELSCPSCVVKIEKALTALNGVDTAKVHFNTGRIEVQHDPQTVGTKELVETVRAVGYEAKVSAF
jgi:copper chaperone CopZ